MGGTRQKKTPIDVGRAVRLIAAALLLVACGEAKTTHYFDSEVDSDIGGERYVEEDAGAQQLAGDPCSADNPWDCEPVGAESCPEGSACDYGQHQGAWGFFCYTDATEIEGASCDEQDGPWCTSGLSCVEGVCRRYCCSDEDCQSTGCEPLSWDYVEGGELGICGD